MAGRKTKLTRELIDEASKLIRAGNYNETVCQYLGIHKSTWYKWLAEGEQANSGLKKEFFDSIKKAEAHAEIRNVQVIQKAANESWQAAMTYLERKFPDRWGRKDKVNADVEHSGQVNVKHDINERIAKYEDTYSKIAGD
jgi:transposase